MLQPATLHWVRQALRSGELSRAALARDLYEPDGWVNARPRLAGPLRLGPRDRHLGWTQRARLANIARGVAHDRLLLPEVRVPHLASHLLG